MKKKLLLIGSILLYSILNAQQNTDILYLKKELITRKYLWHAVNSSKIEYKSIDTTNSSVFSWEIDKFFATFKEVNLQTIQNDLENVSYKLKFVNKRAYIIEIVPKYKFLLGKELTSINNISLPKIIHKLQTTFYLPNQNTIELFIEKHLSSPSLLQFLKLAQKDSIIINKTIKIPLNSFETEKLKIEKPLFKDRKNTKWFWSYGINFGQQFYIKFSKILSSEHYKKMHDSLKWRNYKYATSFKIPLQQTYNPPKLNDLLQKIQLKFSKKRYKKLILDFRDCTIGTSYDVHKFTQNINKIKKLHRKKRIYILVNKYTNYASIKYILELQKIFKPIIIGENIYGTNCESDSYDVIELPVSKIKIQIPKNHQKQIYIKPDIIVHQTITQTAKGIDAILNKCTE